MNDHLKQTLNGQAYAQVKARSIVYNYVKERLEKTDTHVTFAADEVYVVWFSKTLKNWKALVSTTLPDGMYYEVTYNGDKCETYLDAYKKFDNVCIPDKP
jgi:ABC-type phosphate/phosphonate transport system substrate-binding protein